MAFRAAFICFLYGHFRSTGKQVGATMLYSAQGAARPLAPEVTKLLARAKWQGQEGRWQK